MDTINSKNTTYNQIKDLIYKIDGILDNLPEEERVKHRYIIAYDFLISKSEEQDTCCGTISIAGSKSSVANQLLSMAEESDKFKSAFLVAALKSLTDLK